MDDQPVFVTEEQLARESDEAWEEYCQRFQPLAYRSVKIGRMKCGAGKLVNDAYERAEQPY